MKESFDKALAIAPTHKKEIQLLTVRLRGENYTTRALMKSIERSTRLRTWRKPFAHSQQPFVVLPESLLTRRTLGLAYLRNNDMPNAAEQFSVAFEQGKDTLSAKLLGKIYIDSGNVMKSEFIAAHREQFETMKNLASIQ